MIFIDSFHVGFLCRSPSTYCYGIKMCSEVIHYAASIGYHITLLDIGGGYPGKQGSEELFAELAKAIHKELTSNDEYSQLRIIAEPGISHHNTLYQFKSGFKQPTVWALPGKSHFHYLMLAIKTIVKIKYIAIYFLTTVNCS